MSSSEISSFSDPDRYAAAIRSTVVEISVTGPEPFTASLTRIDFHRLWMQTFDESTATIAHVAQEPERAIISFLTAPGPEMITHGVSLPLAGIVRHAHGDDYHRHSYGPVRWGAMSLPVAQIAAVSEAVRGSEFAPWREASIVIPPPAALAKLRHLHRAAGRLAQNAPEIIVNPGVARGFEQMLITAMLGCAESEEVHATGLAKRHHLAIMRRFQNALEENPDRALYLPELCAEIGVPERTLRACCQEQLGMGPKRYLMLRRMHLAHRVLSEAAAATTTVADIAARFGFWQFGRFAGAYQTLFGEPPSATLRHPPG